MPCGGELRQVWFVCEWQVKLCDPFVTHGPYLSAVEIHVRHYKALFTVLLLLIGQGQSETKCDQKSLI